MRVALLGLGSSSRNQLKAAGEMNPDSALQCDTTIKRRAVRAQAIGRWFIGACNLHVAPGTALKLFASVHAPPPGSSLDSVHGCQSPLRNPSLKYAIANR
jgi:hypothetical protein